MAKAEANSNIIRLSELTHDPVLKVFFRRGEQDGGANVALPAYRPLGPSPLVLDGLPCSREQIESSIERLIDMLNVADGDPDLEPDDWREWDADYEASEQGRFFGGAHA